MKGDQGGCSFSCLRRAGFTLVELLVTMAIMALILGALLMLFKSSLRSYKSSMQIMEISEETHTAFRVLERDLTGIHTARDSGDSFNFFGTPYGMVMICTVETGKEKYTARVSYVLHEFAKGEDLQTYDLDAFGASVPSDLIRSVGLVRLVEPGIETLDSFPVDWPDIGAGEPAEVTEKNLWYALKYIEDAYGPDNGASGSLLAPASEEQYHVMMRARKAELWLAMLADRPYGYTDYLDPAVPNPLAAVDLPQLWDNPVAPASWGATSPNTTFWQGKLPEDYVVSRGMLTKVDVTATGLNFVDLVDGSQARFEYGCVVDVLDGVGAIQRGGISWRNYWHTMDQFDNVGDSTDPALYPSYPFDRIYGSPFYPFPPAMVRATGTFAFDPKELEKNPADRRFEFTFEVPVARLKDVARRTD